MNVSGAGQKANTRTRRLYDRFQFKIKRAVAKYRAARAALQSLDPDGPWSTRLQPLHDGDVRGPSRYDDEGNTPGEGRYQPSWIWLVPRALGETTADNDPEEFAESMRVEWAQGLARAERWEEEGELLEEEMRRVIEYFEWKSQWWREQASRRSGSDAALLRGLRAYAEKQACVSEGLAQRCVELWTPFMQESGKTPPWASRYTVPPQPQRRARRKQALYDPEDDFAGDEVLELDMDGDMDSEDDIDELNDDSDSESL